MPDFSACTDTLSAGIERLYTVSLEGREYFRAAHCVLVECAYRKVHAVCPRPRPRGSQQRGRRGDIAKETKKIH